MTEIMPRLGIIGGGQLARMMALAARPLGIQCQFLDPDPQACAASLGKLSVAAFDDAEAVRRFADQVDAITFDFENVPASVLSALQCGVAPAIPALETAQDRLSEKRLFRKLGIPIAEFFEIQTLADLQEALPQIQNRGILKTCRLGYDGKGQVRITNADDAPTAWEKLGAQAPLVLEQWVAFEREVSQISVRDQHGSIQHYPLCENHHESGILHHTQAPASGEQSQEMAQQYMTTVLQQFDYVGVLTLEFFQAGDRLLVNEMAPRVHNSGHWTIEACECSQFENHIRAVLGLPLGSVKPISKAVMLNCIGNMPPLHAALDIPGVHRHAYEKADRPGRKVGHYTITGMDQSEVQGRLKQVEEVFAKL